jgi:hypothetical protein
MSRTSHLGHAVGSAHRSASPASWNSASASNLTMRSRFSLAA